MNKTNVFKKLAMIGLLSGLVACSETANNTSSSTASSVDNSTEKVYRVFSEQNYIPFIMHDGGRKVSGFEYDVLMAIADKQGIKIEFVAHTWDDLFNSLKRGDSDILAAGLTITNERKKEMDFTDPHLETETVVLIKNSNIKTMNDLKGKSVTVQSGTLQDEIALSYGVNPDKLKATSTSWLAIKDVMLGNSEVTLGDKVVMEYYQHQYPKEQFSIIKNPNATKEQLGFAIQKNNQELRHNLNVGLAKIKEDGTYQSIHKKWFGS